MKALVVGPAAAWSTADVFRGWCQGLSECGVEVTPFDLANRLVYYHHAAVLEEDGETVAKRMSTAEAHLAATEDILAACYVVDPDVVFVVHGANVTWDLIAKIRCPVVLLLTECPYENENQLKMAAAAEPQLILVNDPTDATVFDEVAPTFYVPHAYQPQVHHPGSGDYKYDCVFVGTGFGNRVDYMRSVDWTGIDLALAGMWSKASGTELEAMVLHDEVDACLDNVDTAELYRAARTSFNIYRADIHGEHSTADGWAIGPREVELAACGTWFARQSRPEGDDLFPMLPVFEHPGELGDLIRWALAHPDLRQSSADAARSAVADRTFAANAARALARL